MDQKGHVIDQKGLKMYEKRTKIGFLALKTCFSAELGGTPLPPLTENHSAQKPLALAEIGGTPSLKNPLGSF